MKTFVKAMLLLLFNSVVAYLSFIYPHFILLEINSPLAFYLPLWVHFVAVPMIITIVLSWILNRFLIKLTTKMYLLVLLFPVIALISFYIWAELNPPYF